MKVGVLALQGAFSRHATLLDRVGVTPVEVRTPGQLADVDALVMPGGESTTMSMLLEISGLREPLADRLAEAFAERLHRHVRTDLWGYAEGEQLTNEALIKEQYRGIRPAPGYPACPDHSLKPILFGLLDAEKNVGITLTESFAMLPTSAVSGFYFGHPEAQYFGVARIGRDQLEDYAARRGVSLEQAERWLRPNLD